MTSMLSHKTDSVGQSPNWQAAGP